MILIQYGKCWICLNAEASWGRYYGDLPEQETCEIGLKEKKKGKSRNWNFSPEFQTFPEINDNTNKGMAAQKSDVSLRVARSLQ